MVELHGWATIRENYFMDDDTDDDVRLDKIIQSIKKHIDTFHWQNGIVDLRAVNGVFHLAVSIFTNHRDTRIDEALGLFQYISRIAPGSYGLLYLNDDEDKRGRENEFVVYVLAKGKLDECKDVYLSPLVPTVEELD